MKRVLLTACALCLLSAFGPAALGLTQGGVRSGPDPTVVRDSELEKESLHNLEVARHYFKMKKAYRAMAAR